MIFRIFKNYVDCWLAYLLFVIIIRQYSRMNMDYAITLDSDNILLILHYTMVLLFQIDHT